MDPDRTLALQVADRHGDAVPRGHAQQQVMWSGIALPSTSSISFRRHNSRRMCPMPRCILPYNTLRRYFGRITTWYLQSHLTWDWLCQSFMAVLPPLGAFLGEDRLTSTSGTAEPIGFAPPEAVDSLLIDPLIEAVIDQDPRTLGYHSTVWTAALLLRHLKRAHGIEVSRKSVSLAITRLGLRWKRPRHQLALRPETWRQSKGG